MLNPNFTRRRMIVIAATAAGSAFVTGGIEVRVAERPRQAIP